MLTKLRFRKGHLVALCAVAAVMSTGCKSGPRMPGMNMFAWGSKPSPETLAGTGPSATYPVPPSVGATPSTIDSVAAGIQAPSYSLGQPESNLASNAAAKLGAVPQSSDDRRLCVLSIAHAYARTSDIGTWLLSGCTLGIVKGYAGWENCSGSFAPTHCNMVPSLASRIIDSAIVPDSLAVIGCGGAAMGRSDFERWHDSGVAVVQGYGLTEAGPVIASQTPQDSIAGHVGRIVDGWETRLDGERLYVRGPGVMRGYWNDSAATAKRIDEQGWLDTGDLVRISDTTRQLVILGRADDRIVLSNGHNVDPHGVESKLSGLDGIRTSFLRACDDGRSVELWIECDANHAGRWTTDEIRRHLDDLPQWARPGAVHPLRIPPADRGRLFNRKGAVRRIEMERYIRSATGS